MKHITLLIISIICIHASDDQNTWTTIGTGKQSIKYQETDLGSGTIRNELTLEDDKDSNFVQQSIIYIPSDPSNALVQDTNNKKTLFTLQTLKTANSPYSFTIMNTIDGYVITATNSKQDSSAIINSIEFSVPLLQSSELKLVMNGHIMQFFKGRD